MQAILHVYLILQDHMIATISVEVGLFALVIALLIVHDHRKRRASGASRQQQRDDIEKLPRFKLPFSNYGSIRIAWLPWLVGLMAVIVLTATPFGDMIATPMIKSAGVEVTATVTKAENYSESRSHTSVIYQKNRRTTTSDDHVMTHVTLRYRNKDGDKVTTRLDTSRTLIKGDTVKMVYLPKYPDDLIFAD